MNRYVIDRAALDGNVRQVVALAGVPVMAVVKANGYGFGLTEMALACKRGGITRFAITELDDIAPLRAVLDEGDDVLVMRSTALADEAAAIVRSGCIATVGSRAAARALDEAAAAAGAVARCHVKVDTGFGRYGFLPDDVEGVLTCYACENLRVEGVYTHFSAAYGDEALTRSQLAALKGVCAAVEAAGFSAGVRHAAKSPALFNVPEAKLDLVRIGSAFTGRVITLAPTGLTRVGYLEAQVIDVKTLPAGSPLGYGGAAQVKRETQVAFVSAGTQEGFGLAVEKPPTLRGALSTAKGAARKRRLEVVIGARAYPVLGEADLSLTLVDVTGGDVQAGALARLDPSPLMVGRNVPRVYV